MATVEYQHATCIYPGMASPAVDDLELGIEDGELMVLVGPSGSGNPRRCVCSPVWRWSTVARS